MKLSYTFILLFTYIHIVAAISFSETVYSIDEDTGFVQPVLVLSKLFLTDITVTVSTTGINATGNSILWKLQLINHMVYWFRWY